MQDELKELKLFVGGKIDYGNRLLALDLVPRDESGAPINPKTAGVMQLYNVVCAILRGMYFQQLKSVMSYPPPQMYSVCVILSQCPTLS